MNRSYVFPRVLRVAAATAALLAAHAPLLSAQAAPSADGLPEAQQLFDRYAEAIGGRDRVMAVSSLHSTAEFEMPAAGIKGAMEIFAGKPNKSFVRMEFPGMGSTTTGFDGTVGWTIDPIQGPALAEGGPLEYMRETADFLEALGNIPDPARYTSMETVGRAEMGGRPCWKVRLISRTGRESSNCYDTETGLLVGMERTQESQMGKIATTILLSDYKEFGGIRMPTKSVASMMGQQMMVATRTVELDTVQASRFELPAEIRLLADARQP